MNLHGIVRAAITTVNPDIDGTHIRSTGYTVGPGFKQIPTYASTPVRIQVQGVNGRDLAHMDSLNIQGVLRTVYMYGSTVGVVRPDGTGGDLINFPQAPGREDQTWKVVNAKETWPDWCCVIVQLQKETVTPP